MKKLLASITMLAILFAPAALATQPVAAVDVVGKFCSSSSTANSSDVCQSVNQQNQNGTNPIIRILKAAIEVVSFIVGVAAVITIIVSGVRFILSGGGDSAAAAQTGLIYAFVGIAIVIFAQIIVVFVLDKI